MDYFLRCTASVNVNVFFDSREIFGFQFALNSELIDSPCFPLLQMDITGAILCLVVVMIISDHVTVRGEEGVCDDTPCLNGGQCIDLSYPGGPQEVLTALMYVVFVCKKHVKVYLVKIKPMGWLVNQSDMKPFMVV